MNLLERFGVDASLLGDLAERRQAGASRVWFWRQAIVAVLLQIVSDLSRHWVLALRALAVGAITTRALSLALRAPAIAANHWFGVTMGNLLLDWQLESIRWNFFRFHVWFLPQVLFAMVGGACAAFLVARTHRAQAMSMVVLFLAATELVWAYQIIDRFQWAAVMPATNQWPYRQFLTAVTLVPTMLLVGLWTAGRRAPSNEFTSN